MAAAQAQGAKLVMGAVTGVAKQSAKQSAKPAGEATGEADELEAAVGGVMLESGETSEADAVVITMGPWGE